MTSLRAPAGAVVHGEARPYPRALPALTSMRFFAAAWVVAMHYSWWLPQGRSIVPVLSQGGMAVDFFFMLSGFVLAHAHYDAIVTRRLRMRDFLVRRLARIYPMHVVTIVFYALMVLLAAMLSIPLPNPDRYGTWQLALNLALLHALQAHDTGAWNYPSWSIGAEWIAYLVFPLIATAILLRGRTWPAGGMLIASGVLLAAAYVAAPWVTGTGYFDLHTNFGWLRILPEFVLGIALYDVGRASRMPAMASPAMAVFLVGLVVVLAWAGMTLAMLVPFALLILSGAEMARDGTGRLSSRLLLYAGETSYALYMVHLPVATLVLRGSRGTGGETPLWSLPVACLCAMTVAMICHRHVEPIGSRLIMRLSDGRRTP